ncbi:GNAT family N-acetyltransferase [Promethearchaeum syntrophicum]|uniref:GNAT family N-acetyltransferase n=1 Tax=Promethearchaeum syntrophicum TaxID=2594042 RepID=A0A5B9DG00_9ARCH|nr:GNAT family protein [Candidatus Prometheoarchaeum syntrophicum]QEE17656.1 ribosomal-protein-S5-alanine N-acetyltransferase [Candidatus Prometheoarchaeum syntrophicum]
MKLPAITTKRLIIRPLKESDIKFFERQYSNPLVQKYTLLHFQNQDEIRDFYLRGCDLTTPDQFRLMLVFKDTLQEIGSIVFEHWDRHHHSVEIGYDLSPEFWGKGLMAEALNSILNFVFSQMKVNRLEATSNPTNHRSINLLKKIGFIQEGMLRQIYYFNSKYYDELIFSMLKEEWNKKKNGYLN